MDTRDTGHVVVGITASLVGYQALRYAGCAGARPAMAATADRRRRRLHWISEERA